MILYTAELRSRHCGCNLAWENAFFEREKSPDALYLLFYENQDAIVLGKSLNIHDEVFLHKGPAVYRRISGGGTVFHCIGNLNYALFLPLQSFPEFQNIAESYQKILGILAPALGRFVVQRGASDLALLAHEGERKISGNAQCRRRGWLMQHGTLLYSKKALRRIPYYLQPPPKEPAYRRGRKHRDFMSTVLPCYNRHELMRRVRLSLAHAFRAELRALPKESPLLLYPNLPFQPERARK